MHFKVLHEFFLLQSLLFLITSPSLPYTPHSQSSSGRVKIMCALFTSLSWSMSHNTCTWLFLEPGMLGLLALYIYFILSFKSYASFIFPKALPLSSDLKLSIVSIPLTTLFYFFQKIYFCLQLSCSMICSYICVSVISYSTKKEVLSFST